MYEPAAHNKTNPVAYAVERGKAKKGRAGPGNKIAGESPA